MIAKYGEDVQAWPWFDDDLYLRAFGPPKKGRSKGFGHKVGIGGRASSSQASQYSASSQFTASQHDIEELRCSVGTMRGEIDYIQARLSTLATDVLDEVIDRLRDPIRPLDESLRSIFLQGLLSLRRERGSQGD